MIARQPRSRPGAKKIQTAVSNVGETELTLNDRKGGAGRSHAGELRVLGCVALNRVMRGAKAAYQRILRIVLKVPVIHEAHGFDREAARPLPPLRTAPPACVTAHPVGDHSQSALPREFFVGIRLPVEARVFVVDALAPDVSEARDFPSGVWGDFTNRHKYKEREAGTGWEC